MKNITKKAFTLVELLVVITILAIISVVAYQSFGGATDKAISARKISDVSTIESSLQQYKVDKKFYPKVDGHKDTNLWGYTGATASASNTISITGKTGSEIDGIDTIGTKGGGRVYGIGDWSSEKTTSRQIGAKGTISQNTLTKQYLTKDLFDPEISDIKFKSDTETKTLIEIGIGRYVYAVFKKPLDNDVATWSENQDGTYYNIAYTIKKEGTDEYITKIVGDYDEGSCFDKKDYCPETLIGNGNTRDEFLKDNDTQTSSDPKNTNQGIPYPVSF